MDSSVAIPLVNSDHESHSRARALVGDRTLGLAGHAALETYSVLTRLPAPWRRSAPTTLALIRQAFPATVHVGAERMTSLLGELVERRIAGGATFDGLVAVAAAEHGGHLITADRRAMTTYLAFGLEVELLDL